MSIKIHNYSIREDITLGVNVQHTPVLKNTLSLYKDEKIKNSISLLAYDSDLFINQPSSALHKLCYKYWSENVLST